MKSNLKIFALTTIAVIAGIAIYNKYQSTQKTA